MEANRWIILLVFSLASAIFIQWLINFVRKCRVLPSGPWGLPVVGYVPFLGSQPHRTLFKLSEKYGKVFSVSLGSETAVVLNSWESIKASLVDQPKVFSGRPKMFLFKAFSDQKDVGSNDGPLWKKQRQSTSQVFKSCGIGHKEMETRVMDLVNDVLDTLHKADGKVLSTAPVFTAPLTKLLWRIITGDNIDKSEMDFHEYADALMSVTKLIQTDGRLLINTFPWLRFVPPNGWGHWEVLRTNERLFKIIKKVVDQQVTNFNEGNVSGLIDHHIAEIYNHLKDGRQKEAPFTLENLYLSPWTNSVAGIETTSTTCLWGVLYMALHPEVQKKAQAEMDEVVGRLRLPNLSDTPRLPYNTALIMEVQRMSSMTSLSLPHRATETTKVLGHTIPKDTTVIQNVYAVHHDPELWDQPEVFKPERFIDGNNKAKAPPYLMPFSVGPRYCPGQPLADVQLKLLFYHIVHQFDLSLPPDQPPPSLIPRVSINLTPLPFSLIFNSRKDQHKS